MLFFYLLGLTHLAPIIKRKIHNTIAGIDSPDSQNDHV